jgi:hypothetical protein
MARNRRSINGYQLYWFAVTGKIGGDSARYAPPAQQALQFGTELSGNVGSVDSSDQSVIGGEGRSVDTVVYRDVEKLLTEWGINVDHVSVYLWMWSVPDFIDSGLGCQIG